ILTSLRFFYIMLSLMTAKFHPQETQKILKTSSGSVALFHLPKLEKLGFGKVSRLPFSLKVLLESALRNCDGYQVTAEDIKRLAGWSSQSRPNNEIAFKPGRVILQDFTGVPCVVDLAAMRSAMKRL